MDETHRDFLTVMGHLYLTNGKPDRAVTTYSCLHTEFPDDPKITLALAYAKLLDGEFSAALDLADQVTKSKSFQKNQPNFDRLIKAKALWHRGKKKAARREMNAFLKTATLGEADWQPGTNTRTKTDGKIAAPIKA